MRTFGEAIREAGFDSLRGVWEGWVMRRFEEMGNKHQKRVVEDIAEDSIGSQGVDNGDDENGRTG
jgi:hypothetical protein